MFGRMDIKFATPDERAFWDHAVVEAATAIVQARTGSGLMLMDASIADKAAELADQMVRRRRDRQASSAA